MKGVSALLLCAAVVILAFMLGRHGGSPIVAPQPGRRVLYYVDPMHPWYRSDTPGTAPDCGMALDPVYEDDRPAASVLPPPGSVALNRDQIQLAGIQVVSVEENRGLSVIHTTGRITANENRVYRVMAGFDGWVETLEDTPSGTKVKKGQRLAVLSSPEFRTAETAYLGFLASLDRWNGNLESTDQKRIEESARINEELLRSLGVGSEQIDEIKTTRRVGSSIRLTSPANGVVLSRTISPRQRIEKGSELFRIADLRTVWVLADLPTGTASTWREGQRVKMTARDRAKHFYGSVTAGLPLLEPVSRTLKLRLEVDNADLSLLPDMYVTLEIQTKMPASVSLPMEAVLDSGLRKIVYVETSRGNFEPRTVEIAGYFGDNVAIASGLSAGEKVAVSGTFLLDSESRMHSPLTVPIASKPASEQKTVANGVRDPVCGMTLKTEGGTLSKVSEEYLGQKIVFCSESCRKKFHEDPSKYVAPLSGHVSSKASSNELNHD